MSARRIVMPFESQSAEAETDGLRPRSPGLTPTALWGENPVADSLSCREDSERLLDELLRQFGTAEPLPWRHGGLNE